MSSVTDWAGRLEAREKQRSRTSLALARKAVARRLGIAPGTLENIARGRTKGVRDWIAQRIHEALIRETEQEIGRLTHELKFLRECRVDAYQIQISEVEAHLAEVRRLLSPTDAAPGGSR